MQTFLRQRCRLWPAAAFTLTELLVVIAVLAILAVTQLPALSRAKSPVKLTQCMNNVRQIGMATLLYKDGNNDTYPTGTRVTSPASTTEPTGWPRLILKYMGVYKTNVQPAVFVCPNEKEIAKDSWGDPYPVQLHFTGNRKMICDVLDCGTGIRGSQMSKPSIYWMFMEKGPYDFGNVTSGTLLQLHLMTWNQPPNDSPGMRRHNGGLTATAADGHADWLRMPFYQPNTGIGPENFAELGDCVTGGQNGAFALWNTNGPRVKLWTRYSTLVNF